jgi:REP element-mobilizing transposase RayT
MGRYRANEHIPYFCTVTILDWLPVLIEQRYIDPIIESLRFCRERKGLALFAYVVMPNHLHMIAGTDGDLHALMRDFKRFTTRTVHDRLKQDGRTTLLNWLADATQRARQQRDELGLWKAGFHPQAISSRPVFEQKLRYLHENPMPKGLVARPEDWRYSSAAFYAGREGCCLEMDGLEL